MKKPHCHDRIINCMKIKLSLNHNQAINQNSVRRFRCGAYITGEDSYFHSTNYWFLVFVFNEETKTRCLCSFDRTWPLLWRMHHTLMSSKLPQRPSSMLRSTGRLTPRNSRTLQVAGSAGFLPVTGGVRQGKTSPQEDRHHGTPDQTKQCDGNQRSNWREVSSPSSATLGPLTLDE